MPEKRRQYEQEFKEGAVRIVRESGKSIAEIALDLDINAGTLGNWVARDRGEREGAQGLSTDDDVAELKRLRSENAQLRMERDVLKRSVALWVAGLCRVWCWIACGARDPRIRPRHNQSPSRKSSSASGGRYRPGVVSSGAVRASARSFRARSACR